LIERLSILLNKIFSNRLNKEKGGPKTALPVPETGMDVSDGFRLSHHVHTACSARLTR
jgi:hypothetical protein